MSTPPSFTLRRCRRCAISLAHAIRRPRARSSRELDRLFRRARTPPAEFETARCTTLRQSIEASVAYRRAPQGTAAASSNTTPALPITAHREEIAQGVTNMSISWSSFAAPPVRARPPSCPRSAWKRGAARFGLIGHTQPRRIAARAIANRLAEELQTTVGGAVGYQVRFNDRTGPDTASSS